MSELLKKIILNDIAKTLYKSSKNKNYKSYTIEQLRNSFKIKYIVKNDKGYSIALDTKLGNVNYDYWVIDNNNSSYVKELEHFYKLNKE